MSRPHLIVLQSGGPTAVLNASLAGIITEARNSFDAVLGSHAGFEGLLHRKLVDLSGLSADELARLARTPSAALATSRFRPSSDDIDDIVRFLAAEKIGAVVGIGGNDTSDSLNRLARRSVELQAGIRVIGVPKTIDNDLAGTDHSLGFPSAARYLAAYTRDAIVDGVATAAQYPVKFIEVMGRNAGWLAASTSLWIPAECPNPIVSLPERPFTGIDQLLTLIETRVESERFACVIVPETMRWSDGGHVSGGAPEWIDAFGHPYYASAGQTLLRETSIRLGYRGKLDRPGSVSRASIDYGAEVDFREAEECGQAAVHAADAGRSGCCVVIERLSSAPYRSRPSLTPLESLAGVERLIPDEFLGEPGDPPNADFYDYAEPLIGDPTLDYFFLPRSSET